MSSLVSVSFTTGNTVLYNHVESVASPDSSISARSLQRHILWRHMSSSLHMKFSFCSCSLFHVRQRHSFQMYVNATWIDVDSIAIEVLVAFYCHVDDDRTIAPPERCWSQGRARRYMDSVTQIILCSTEAHLSNVYERHVNWCWLQCHRCSCCVLLSHTWVDVVMKDSPPFYTQRTVKTLCKLRFWSLGNSRKCLDWVTQIGLFYDDAQLSDVCICMYVCRSRLVTRWSFAGL